LPATVLTFAFAFAGGAIAQVSSDLSAETAKALDRAQAAIADGQFALAEQLLRPHMTSTSGSVVEASARQIEIMRRIRLDHPLDQEQILEQLRSSISDVTADDLARWRDQGVLQHRVIDGDCRYFERAVGNLLRACDEARSRRAPPAPSPAGRFDLPKHLAALVEESKQADGPLIHPVRHRVRYELSVKDGNPHVRPGARVRCWLPFPQQYRQQSDVRLISTDPPGGIVAPLGTAQRTIYFEQVLPNPAETPRFVAEFEFVTHASVRDLRASEVKPYDTAGSVYREFTAERAPHVVFTPEVRALAARIVGEERNPLEKARKIFRWVSQNVRWCAEMEYSTIPNLSAKGLAAGRGDCGVQSMCFITLCRAAGVPARWQSGWQTTPGRRNMHDWSEFYVEPWGWLPADASYGLQDHPDPPVAEFYCGNLDPYRLIVNLDYGRELSPPKTSFRSEPADFQRGEIEIDGRNLYFDEWRWRFDVETMPFTGGFARLEETMDALAPRLLEDGGIPGAVVHVGRKRDHGFDTWQRAYGFMQTEPERRSMREDAIFDMASLTKPVATGMSMMTLIERGKVKLDDPVGKYLPEFAAGEKSQITVRHLMTHTSGLSPYVGAATRNAIIAGSGSPCVAATRQHIRESVPTRAPGDTVTYSCLNAILCAEIVEAVSGMSLDRFASTHVFEPLGMVDTGFHPGASAAERCCPSTRCDRGLGPGGYLRGQVHDPLAAMQAGVSGNAGLFSTARDLARVAQALLSGGELNGVRVLSEESVRDMTRIQNTGAVGKNGEPDRRGLLWDLYPPDAGETGIDRLFAYGHTGYTGTAMRIYPEKGLYIIVLANRVHPDDSAKISELRTRLWHTVGKLLLR
jgi:CubicO group peptidase (beta-lactamase class C family)